MYKSILILIFLLPFSTFPKPVQSYVGNWNLADENGTLGRVHLGLKRSSDAYAGFMVWANGQTAEVIWATHNRTGNLYFWVKGKNKIHCSSETWLNDKAFDCSNLRFRRR